MTSNVRIISGKWRRRRLDFPSESKVRPTLDRRREQLFSWLTPEVGHATCLDLCAGTGALGFEAASRGAQDVTMLEPDTVLFNSLQNNQKKLEATNIELINGKFADYQAQLETKTFDIIFCDPPFADNELITAITAWLADYAKNHNVIIYFELPPQYDSLIHNIFPNQVTREKLTNNYWIGLVRT